MFRSWELLRLAIMKAISPPPAQHHGIELAGDFNEARTRRRVDLLQGMTNRCPAAHAAFLHQNLGGLPTALAVLVIDQRPPACIGPHRFFPAPCEIGIDDRPDAV